MQEIGPISPDQVSQLLQTCQVVDNGFSPMRQRNLGLFERPIPTLFPTFEVSIVLSNTLLLPFLFLLTDCLCLHRRSQQIRFSGPWDVLDCPHWTFPLRSVKCTAAQCKTGFPTQWLNGPHTGHICRSLAELMTYLMSEGDSVLVLWPT